VCWIVGGGRGGAKRKREEHPDSPAACENTHGSGESAAPLEHRRARRFEPYAALRGGGGVMYQRADEEIGTTTKSDFVAL
jgi:hypothetical protein